MDVNLTSFDIDHIHNTNMIHKSAANEIVQETDLCVSLILYR